MSMCEVRTKPCSVFVPRQREMHRAAPNGSRHFCRANGMLPKHKMQMPSLSVQPTPAQLCFPNVSGFCWHAWLLARIRMQSPVASPLGGIGEALLSDGAVAGLSEPGSPVSQAWSSVRQKRQDSPLKKLGTATSPMWRLSMRCKNGGLAWVRLSRGKPHGAGSQSVGSRPMMPQKPKDWLFGYPALCAALFGVSRERRQFLGRWRVSSSGDECVREVAVRSRDPLSAPSRRQH
ncbi:hypothetical protein AK812_SmicGene33952 [Symbiodinium microadriaticum]|uniref:Uncharacterized protein n=1 Tax=Symbiodinium microadriaticum TaxID=2951 RepID=A0A1Q9CQA9_SYMMI|nr:hypothetical protein AK812_SmicGene33952 [Symbiodinium microadriaticum]